jgi:hypothetical protein
VLCCVIHKGSSSNHCAGLTTSQSHFHASPAAISTALICCTLLHALVPLLPLSPTLLNSCLPSYHLFPARHSSSPVFSCFLHSCYLIYVAIPIFFSSLVMFLFFSELFSSHLLSTHFPFFASHLLSFPFPFFSSLLLSTPIPFFASLLLSTPFPFFASLLLSLSSLSLHLFSSLLPSLSSLLFLLTHRDEQIVALVSEVFPCRILS